MTDDGGRPRVLIIADDPGWLEFARAALTDAGHQVAIGQGLANSASLASEPNQLAFVDMRVAERESAAMRQLADAQGGSNRVIVMAATDLLPGEMSAMFKMGALDCINKPYDKQTLLSAVDKYIDRPIPQAVALPRVDEPAVAILVVEDDPDWRTRLISYLASASRHYIIESARDCQLALELAAQRNFDVVVLDLRLVDEGDNFEGMELLKVLRAQGGMAAVIIVSGYGTLEHVRDAFQDFRIHDFIPKQSFDREQYRQSVAEAVQRRRTRR